MAASFPLQVVLSLLDRFTAPLGTVGGALEGFGKKAEKVGKKLSLGVTAPLVAFGALSAKTGIEYQRSLNRVQAITGASAEVVEDLARAAEKTLGEEGIPSKARRTAAAMAALAHSGESLAEVQTTLPHVVELATAAVVDEGEAAKDTADVLDIYGLKAKDAGRVTDLLALASARSEQELAGVVAGLTAAGSTARAFHQELEPTAAVLDVLADAGFEGAAGAALYKRALAALARPVGATEQTLRRLRITQRDLFKDDGTLRAFDEILVTLTQHGATARDAIGLFGARAGAGLASLLGPGATRVRAFAQELRGADGAALHLAKVALGGGVGDLERFQEQWERLLVTVAKSGLLEALARLATVAGGVLDKVSALPRPVLETALTVAAAAAALGPFLVGMGRVLFVFGRLLPLVPTVASAVGGLVAAVFTPLGLAIAAVVAATAALYVHWDVLKTKALDVWGSVKRTVGDAVDWIGAKLSAVGDLVPSWLADLLGGGEVPGAAAARAAAAARGKPLGRARLEAAGRGALEPARAHVGGAVQVEFRNVPPGTRIRTRQAGDVPLDVDTGLNLAAGLSG